MPCTELGSAAGITSTALKKYSLSILMMVVGYK